MKLRGLLRLLLPVFAFLRRHRGRGRNGGHDPLLWSGVCQKLRLREYFFMVRLQVFFSKPFSKFRAGLRLLSLPAHMPVTRPFLLPCVAGAIGVPLCPLALKDPGSPATECQCPLRLSTWQLELELEGRGPQAQRVLSTSLYLKQRGPSAFP